jgi:crotonobetainyl-CoA:carnitine CoA-transferase CaiB-like acyl-CoA transferase
VFAQPDLFADPRFRTNNDRVKHRPVLRELVARVLCAYPAKELAGILERAGIPFSPVNTPSDLFTDLQVLAHALEVQMPSGATVPLPGLPVSIANETPGLRSQPPGAGEHTDAILGSIGYSEPRITALRMAGIIA